MLASEMPGWHHEACELFLLEVTRWRVIVVREPAYHHVMLAS